MSNRCPDCAKMVSLEFQDPEVDGDIEGEVTPPRRNLVRVAPHKSSYRVTRVYITDEEIAAAKALADNGDDWIGYAYGPGRLVNRGWLHWSGEQLEVGDEVTGIEILRRPGAFRTP